MVPQSKKMNKNAVAPCSFYCRNKIAVSGNKKYPLGNIVVAYPCDIKTDFDIDPFLSQIEIKTFIRIWCFFVAFLF